MRVRGVARGDRRANPRRMRLALALLAVTLACKSAPGGNAVVGPSDSGPADSGPLGSARNPCSDAGPEDAGIDAGPALPPDTDAGPPAPPPDAGPNPHVRGSMGWGPFPQQPLTVYHLPEAPVSASVDEGENLWAVSEKALYLLMPGAHAFRRYTAADGLHYGSGYTDPPDITMVEGGGPGECFVGYYAHDTNDGNTPGAHTYIDPIAHMGKMDQVLLQPDGSLKVNRYDLRNSNDGRYYETRTVMSMVYDHFQHPGNLYVGSNHGITRIIPAKYVPQHIDPNDPGNTQQETTWFADHVHAWVCLGAPCTRDTNLDHAAFGDWFGLTDRNG